MTVGTAGSVTPASSSPSPVPAGMRRFPARGEFAGDMTDGLNQLLGHPTDGGKHLPQGQPRQDATPLLDPMLAFPGGPFFQGVIDLMTDPAGLLHGLPHGKNQTGDRCLRPLLEVQAMGLMRTDTITAAGFAEVGMTLAGMNQHHGHLGLVAVSLSDHFGGGAELAGGAVHG